jgi:hypothetical protein
LEKVFVADRRGHGRIRGPFDAVRLDLLETTLRIYDLSMGGCLIESLSEVTGEHPIRLRIALPDGHSVTVRGRVMLPPRDIGYAVRFIDLDAATRDRIEQALAYVNRERSTETSTMPVQTDARAS